MYYIRRFLIIFLVLFFVACSNENDRQLSMGEGIYKANCKVCHSQGINGAPVFGNKKNWADRAPQGIDALVEHASNGYGLMPAKGGKTELGEEDIRAAITYMLSALED